MTTKAIIIHINSDKKRGKLLKYQNSFSCIISTICNFTLKNPQKILLYFNILSKTTTLTTERFKAKLNAKIVLYALSLPATFLLSAPASAYYWTTVLPPLGGDNSLICDDGFSCARQQQTAFYGTGIFRKGCTYSHNSSGQLVTATCRGTAGPNSTFVRHGHATLRCEQGEVRTTKGCVTAPPPQKNRTCPTTQENQKSRPSTELGNPVDVRSGRKIAYAQDFSTGGPQPLTFWCKSLTKG